MNNIKRMAIICSVIAAIVEHAFAACSCHYGDVPVKDKVESSDPIVMSTDIVARVVLKDNPTNGVFHLSRGTETYLGTYCWTNVARVDFSFQAGDPDIHVCETGERKGAAAMLEPLSNDVARVEAKRTTEQVTTPYEFGKASVKDGVETWKATWPAPPQPGLYTFDTEGFLADRCGDHPDSDDTANLDVSCFRAAMTLIKVESVSIHVPNTDGVATISYRVLPTGTTLSSCAFTAPGKTQTKTSVSGMFSFAYDQHDLELGDNTIRLAYLSSHTDITARRQSVGKGPASEIVVALYPENQDPPVIVPILIGHRLSELYWRITYSGAPVLHPSHILHVGKSLVTVEAPSDRSIKWVVERHKYKDDDGTHNHQIMTLFDGPALPPSTDYRKYYDSTDDAFFKPGNGLQGIAQLDGIAFDESGGPGGGVQPINLTNEEVDQTLE